MRRIIAVIFLITLLSTATSAQKNSDFYIYGRIKESAWKTDLTNALVLWPDSTGTRIDTIKTSGKTYKHGELIDISMFSVPVSRKDSTYVFDIICEGYNPYTMVYDLRKVGKREKYRDMPTVYMTKAPRQLDEVTVTATKVKFYNKGDTIVFNADAFQLAEGSMLDALISQLPGVELSDNGQIKVNGKFVESLLLNGKQFLDGNNQLMFENIAAYTVKNVEVYEGQTREEKWSNDPKKHLTMDVKLKKEYNNGWIINAQGGYGTKERYTGRLFASWFSPTTNVAIMGNINNLNDNREPGKNDSWTPDMMPSGTKEYRLGGITYNYESPEEDKYADGNFIFKQTINRNRTTTARTNFLSGGDTYDNSFNRSLYRDTRYDTRHTFGYSTKKYNLSLYLTGRYRDIKNSASDVAATFDSEQHDLTMAMIEAMYSDGSPVKLSSVINRSITRTDGSHKELSGGAYPSFRFKIPNSNDFIMFSTGFYYKNEKEELWKDYDINYGADPTPAYRRRQYFDNTPNHFFEHNDELMYRFTINRLFAYISYQYQFTDLVKDSYMYALDRLADMGIYGTLPSGYLASFDPSNSYTSRLIENTHTFNPRLYYNLPVGKAFIAFSLGPSFSLKHSHFDYMRNDRKQLVKRSNFLYSMTRYNANIRYFFGELREGDDMRGYRNNINYDLEVQPKTPDPVDMVDVLNDSDPMNIYSGNPDLKVEYRVGHSLRWDYSHRTTSLSNSAEINYSSTRNALTKGYVYDTETGVRHFKTYNTGGNFNYGASNSLRYQFGSKKQFTLSSITDLNYYNYGDMIGVNLSEPTLSKVGNRNFNEKLNLSWQVGKQMFELRGAYTNRHTTSDREDFSTINANHYNIGLTGRFTLPAGFGINTDFTVYTRRGYGVKELDTSDAIWNMRLTWSPLRHKRWVFMIDGFDMLHQLSNVNYAVSATGRTVSYSNALPRYMLFSVQYRLNIQPKKR